MSNEILEVVEEMQAEMIGDSVLVAGEERDILNVKAFCQEPTGDLVPHGVKVASRDGTPEPVGIGIEIEGEGYVSAEEFQQNLETGEWEEPR